MTKVEHSNNRERKQMTADLNDAGGRRRPDDDDDEIEMETVVLVGPEMEAALNVATMYAACNVDRAKARAKMEAVKGSGDFAECTFEAMLNQVGGDNEKLLSSFIATVCTAVFQSLRENLIAYMAKDSSTLGKVRATTVAMESMTNAFNKAFTMKITFDRGGWHIDSEEKGNQ